jgi:hypothetical protein
LAIQIVEGLLRAFLRCHLDKAETARAAGHPIQHQGNFTNLAARGELLLDEIFSGVKREVTNVQTIRHFGTFLSCGLEHSRNHPQPRRGRILKSPSSENAAPM